MVCPSMTGSTSAPHSACTATAVYPGPRKHLGSASLHVTRKPQRQEMELDYSNFTTHCHGHTCLQGDREELREGQSQSHGNQCSDPSWSVGNSRAEGTAVQRLCGSHWEASVAGVREKQGWHSGTGASELSFHIFFVQLL